MVPRRSPDRAEEQDHPPGIEDAKESLLRSRWDLAIVDEAHKMAAYSADKKPLAYKLGEALTGNAYE